MSHSPQAAAYLAYIAYTDSAIDTPSAADFTSVLSQVPAGTGTNGPWSLVWGPAENDGIVLYVAQGADGSLCLAFRGTNTDEDVTGFYENVWVDLDVLEQLPFPSALSPVGNISTGTKDALALAMMAVGTVASSGTPSTVVDFLRQAASNGADIMVTGHSLGGALTLAGSVWLQTFLPNAQHQTYNVFPYTFAAPSIGDTTFAAAFAKMFPSYYAAVNSNDIVPMAWADLSSVLETYPSFSIWDSSTGIAPIVAGLYCCVPDYASVAAGNPDDFTITLVGATSWLNIAQSMHSMKNIYFAHVLPDATAPTLPNSTPVGAIRRRRIPLTHRPPPTLRA